MHIAKKYFSWAKTFWVKSLKEKNAKQIRAFNFSTLYTKTPHDKLLDILYKVLNFVFKGGTRDYIIINKEGCALWSSKKEGITLFLRNHYLKRQ